MITFSALNVESLLNCELPPVVKTSLQLPSPTFPIPGSSEVLLQAVTVTTHRQECPPLVPVVKEPSPVCEMPAEKQATPVEMDDQGDCEVDEKKLLLYTPDEEDVSGARVSKDVTQKYEEVENTNYVPPFNNPLYPNSSFEEYGSSIGK